MEFYPLFRLLINNDGSWLHRSVTS